MAFTRANIGLGIVVLALGALRFVAGGTEATSLDNGSAFGAFDPKLILRLSIDDGGESGPIAMKRESKSAPWLVEGRKDFPALAYPVEGVLAALRNLRASDLVSEEASSHELFGVTEAAGTLVTCEAPGGTAWKFVLGGLARGAGGTRTYLRSTGEARVFAATGLGSPSSDARSWIDPSLVEFDVTLITKIEIEAAGVVVVLKASDKGIWRDTTKNLVAPRIAIEDLIGEASNLVLSDISTAPFDPVLMGFGGEELRVTLSGNEFIEGAFDPIVIVLGAKESTELRMASGGGDRPRQFVRSGAWMRDEGKSWVGVLDADAGDAFFVHVLEIFGAILRGS